MAWLLREGEVLAAVETIEAGWPATIQGAVVKRGPVFVHTLRCPAARDLAWCADGRTEAGDPCLVVRHTASMAPKRLGRPQLKGGAVIVAERGAFERWQLKVGDQLEIRET